VNLVWTYKSSFIAQYRVQYSTVYMEYRQFADIHLRVEIEKFRLELEGEGSSL
jgi:hypothetical protein